MAECSAMFTVAMLLLAVLRAQTPSPVTKVVDQYCATCHNGRVEITGRRLTPFDPAHIADNRELWSHIERQLRAGTMPPVGAPRPDRRTADEAIATIERELDTPAPVAATSEIIATCLASMLWNTEPDAALKKARLRVQVRDTRA